MNNFINNFLFILFCLFFCFPLFKENINNAIFIITSLVCLFVQYKKKQFNFDKNIIIYSIPFWIILIFCIFRMTNFSDLTPIKNALYFFLIPFIFNNIPINFFSNKNVTLYLNLLKYVCLIICITYIVLFLNQYSFFDLFLYSYKVPKFRNFVYNEIPIFRIHPTYFTSILILCIFNSFIKFIYQKKYSEMIYVVFYITITFMLSVKINIIFIFILISYIILFKLHSTKYLRYLVFFIFITCFGIFGYNVPGVEKRFVELVESYSSKPQGKSYDSTNIRRAIFECSVDVAKPNLLFGVGFAQLQTELLDCYKSKYDSDFYKNPKLTHNYFFYILLSSGLLGLCIYLIWVFKITNFIYKYNQLLCSIIMLNIFILNFTEDFFYRQNGVFFFNLLFFTYYFNHKYQYHQLND